MTGHIRRRGERSWELKFDVDGDLSGKRQIRYVTVRGTKKDAERELTKLLNARNQGTFIELSKITVADYIRSWLGAEVVIGIKGKQLGGKTLERFRQLAEQQIIPHLGGIALQKLGPHNIQGWDALLLERGGKDGAPLSARTVGHAHRLLHATLARAVRTELIARNVASIIAPPRLETTSIEILADDQVKSVLITLRDHSLCCLVTLALATGARRGELLGLQWGDIDLDAATLKVQRSVEETKNGLRLKSPKTESGRRTISLPRTAVEMLRDHLRSQREVRLALGQGKESPDTLIFSTPTGDLRSPDNVSRDWARTVKARKLPAVSFHALRHTHASALIASGLDVVKVSHRLGHSSPNVTLTTYAHLFKKTDKSAADAIEATLTFGA